MKTFRAKEGGIPDAILIILKAIPEDKFATPRWVNSILFKAGIEREDKEIRYLINRMKRTEPYIRKNKTNGKEYTSNVKPTIKSLDIKEGDDDFVDIESRGRDRIVYKVCLNDYGRKKVLDILKLL